MVKEEEEDAGTPGFMHVIIILATAGIGIFNVTFDWLWVDDMLNAESSLVFGRPSDVIIGFMITIATVGTIVVILEVANLVMKFYFDKLLLQENKAQLISLFVEEVPSMTLNMLLASCREMPVSVFQMVSAGFGMISAFFRMFRVFWKWLTARRKGARSGFIPFVLRTIVLTACVYCALAAVLAWVFTYSTPPTIDKTGVVPPDNLIGRDYDSQRYFYKAGIFFSHPQFNRCNNNTERNWFEENGEFNWLQFMDLITYTSHFVDPLRITFRWTNDTNQIYVEHRPTGNRCFSTVISGTTCTVQNITDQPECSSPTDDTGFDGVIRFAFRQIEMSKTLVFGDIRFGATLTYNDTCQYLRTDEFGVMRPEGQEQGPPVCRLHYMKTEEGIPYNIEQFNEGNNGFSYFRKGDNSGDYELYNVTDVWLTGFRECEMTGSNMPNNDRSLVLQPC